MTPGRSTALVTGGSGGIGLELARCLARDGYDLVIAARGEAALAAAAPALRAAGSRTVTTVPVDLAEAEGVARLLDTLQRSSIDVDVLVNNAGFGTFGPFTASDAAADLGMIDLNVRALTQLTRALIPGMIVRGSGRVLNIASTAAFQPGPYMAVYYATKAYVLSFSEALAEELRESPVTVTVLCPGPTATGFAERAGISPGGVWRKESIDDARAVALEGYAGMLRGDRIVIAGTRNKLLVGASRLAPRNLVTRVMGRINRGRSGGDGPS